LERFVRAVQVVRSDLLDGAGLGLLAVAAFTWSSTAGFAAAGLATLVWNWRMESGAGE
jgi:hypothetical protein